jgi:DNA-binding NarL/FixJ family response regulator
MTTHGAQAPEITRRERDVLIELCRPAAESDLFCEPSSVRDIAASLRVSEAAIKQHLLNLYEKFAIEDCGERRRVALAREAMRRDVVTVGELRSGVW